MDEGQSVGDLKRQAKFFGGWNSVDKDVDVDLHRKYEDGAVKFKGDYNHMYSGKEL